MSKICRESRMMVACGDFRQVIAGRGGAVTSGVPRRLSRWLAGRNGCSQQRLLTQIKAPRPIRGSSLTKESYPFAIGEAAMSGHQQAWASKPLVIVVDDDQAVRNALKFWLEVEGFAVRIYAGGATSSMRPPSRLRAAW
jgi:hypothetical protein